MAKGRRRTLVLPLNSTSRSLSLSHLCTGVRIREKRNFTWKVKDEVKNSYTVRQTKFALLAFLNPKQEKSDNSGMTRG